MARSWQVPWVSRYADPVMATGYHMLLGGLPLLALSITRESSVLAERLPQLTGEPGCCNEKMTCSWICPCIAALCASSASFRQGMKDCHRVLGHAREH